MQDESSKFLGEEIKVTEAADGGEPISFRWRGEDHRVTGILRSWQDWGHSPGAFKKDWKNRRHRNYYEIETDQGFRGLIYFDRGVKPSSPRKWVIFERYE